MISTSARMLAILAQIDGRDAIVGATRRVLIKVKDIGKQILKTNPKQLKGSRALNSSLNVVETGR